jgi:predicted PurR-regulated permease PerM
VVNRLERLHIPSGVGAAVLLLAIIGSGGGLAYSLADDAAQLLSSLPEAAQKLRQAVHAQRGGSAATIQKVQRAAAQIEQAAEETGAVGSPASRGVMRVQIEKPRFNVQDYLWSGTMGLMALIGQAVVVCFITFFLLASGDSFRRKMIKIAGPSFTKKKITLHALDEISEQIERYMLVQVFTSGVVGVLTWLAFWAIGLEHAAVWGVAAGVLNLVPYVGAIAVTGGASLLGFLQFGGFEMAMWVGGVSFLIQSLEGYLLTPWLTSRASRMSPVAVFVGVLAWGWLWGVWGLLLGMPILLAVKAVCDHVEDFKPLGELLGE